MAQDNNTRRGRIIVTGLYTAILVCGSISIFGSMLRQIYGPPTLEAGAPAERLQTWCAGQLANLRLELESRALEQLHTADQRDVLPARWERLQRRWNERFGATRAQCAYDPAMADAYNTLQELAMSYGAILVELGGVREHISAHLDETIRRLSAH
jgi:hypothetical protein